MTLATPAARSLWKSAKLVEKSNPEGINQYSGGGGGISSESSAAISAVRDGGFSGVNHNMSSGNSGGQHSSATHFFKPGAGRAFHEGLASHLNSKGFAASVHPSGTSVTVDHEFNGDAANGFRMAPTH
jgi:hypothetical protein